MRQITSTWKEKWTQQPTLMLITIIIWSIFIGLCIEAGALLFTFFYSFVKPGVALDLYEGINLYSLLTQNSWFYVGLVALILSISILKAQLFYTMIRIFFKIDLIHPFSKEIAKLISTLSYITLEIGLFLLITKSFVSWLLKRGFAPEGVQSYLSGAFEYFLLSALIFAIAQVFRRGVEIQKENDLTV
ncbi:DUF2975 domain-containing protein [Daejeonella sp.]|uniref:DUF2975 domain-containing protein n=1 Tax=Daejeonella sp. TaxID=2805397 RepID=UPI0025C2F981|nr:DUF2975 domain-containing protein [Daejeonella sp.]